jgi:tartronate-semialdehyde synthase
VKSPTEIKAAFARAEELMEEHQVPVVLEFILERVTNISMGTEINDVNEFEEILCLDPSLSIRKSQDMRTAEKAKEALADKR